MPIPIPLSINQIGKALRLVPTLTSPASMGVLRGGMAGFIAVDQFFGHPTNLRYPSVYDNGVHFYVSLQFDEGMQYHRVIDFQDLFAWSVFNGFITAYPSIREIEILPQSGFDTVTVNCNFTDPYEGTSSLISITIPRRGTGIQIS